MAAEVWRRVVRRSLRDAPRLRPRSVRILGSAYTYLPTYLGRYCILLRLANSSVGFEHGHYFCFLIAFSHLFTFVAPNLLIVDVV